MASDESQRLFQELEVGAPLGRRLLSGGADLDALEHDQFVVVLVSLKRINRGVFSDYFSRFWFSEQAAGVLDNLIRHQLHADVESHTAHHSSRNAAKSIGTDA